MTDNQISSVTSVLSKHREEIGRAISSLSSISDEPFLQGLTECGLQSAFPDLERSEVRPDSCFGHVRRSLRFLGHTGSKWRKSQQLKSFLGRMDSWPGSVNFLLSDSVEQKAMSEMLDLQSQYKSFVVKIYSARPLFRIVEVDRSFISVQPYPSEITTGGNWDLGVLVFVPAPDSFHDSFSRYFDQTWESALPLEQF